MSSSIVSPFPFFTDTTGAPLEGGYLYIGQSNLNPETAPVNVFWDAARTIPAAQPIRTIGGFPSRNGSPSNVYVDADTYSITVRNSRRVFVYNSANTGNPIFEGYPVPGMDVSFIQAGTGAVTRNMQDKARESVSVLDFGAVGDGITNDAPAFHAACTYLSSIGGGTINYFGKHLIDQNLTVPRNVTIQGPTGRCDPGNAFAGRTGLYEALQAVPKLIINPAISIFHLGSGGFDKVYFTRKGLALDGTDLATNYSGTVLVTGETDAVFVTDSSFLGFERASNATGTARVKWNDVFIDCNNGIKQTNSNDQNEYNHIHCYNVLIWGITGNSDPRTLRNGIAFEFTGSFNGGPTLFDCFEYGYTEGFHFDCQGSYKLINCWSDGPSNASGALNPNSVGVFIRSKTNTYPDLNAELQITEFTCSSKGTGIAVGTPAIPNMYGATFVNVAHIFGCNVGINCYAEKLVLSNVAIRSYYQTGLLFNSKASADSAILSNLYFYDAQAGATAEINCGAGDPFRTNIITTGRGRYLNCIPYSATRDNTGLVVIEDSREQINITSIGGTTGQIGDLFPKMPGRVVTLTFISAGFSINNDANFRLVGAVNLSGGVGTTITLRRNDADTQWVEQSRSVF